MDGLINVVKPSGMTSFDLTAYIGRRLGIKKIGHTGTLDPGACGLMTLCLGKATKISEMLMSKSKSYIAEIIFGKTTDSLDSYGNTTEVFEYKYDKKKLEEVLPVFLGDISQLPPMFSAVKIDGRKLYESARKGIEVKRKNRIVNIKSISIIDDEDPYSILIKIDCSKGTYIRSLIYDIGNRYGCGAHMGFLLRTTLGSFDIADAHTIEEVVYAHENNDLWKMIINIEDAIDNCECLVLTKEEEKRFLNGVFIEQTDPKIEISDSIIKVFGEEKRFLGIGKFIMKGEKVFLKTKKLLIAGNDTNR